MRPETLRVWGFIWSLVTLLISAVALGVMLA